ncbi:hypothetical protein Plhal304r1_c019g0068651 [Plasmopara halstedii]
MTIDATESVDDLKKAIKKEKKKSLKMVDADKLQLFLARQGDNTWLETSTDDGEKLKKGATTALIKALTHEDCELEGSLVLRTFLRVCQNRKSSKLTC